MLWQKTSNVAKFKTILQKFFHGDPKEVLPVIINA